MEDEWRDNLMGLCVCAERRRNDGGGAVRSCTEEGGCTMKLSSNCSLVRSTKLTEARPVV